MKSWILLLWALAVSGFNGQQRTLTKISAGALFTAACLWCSAPMVVAEAPMVVAEAPSQSQYDSYAASYDALDGGAAADILNLNTLREEASRDVKGDVLEVAVGTGLQLDYLRNNHNIKSITGIDKSDGMLSEARKRLALLPSSEFPVKLSTMDAAAMAELPNDAFDTVQSTFSFCVFDEPQRVIQEMRRVVKPEGRILVLENSRSTFRPLALLQDMTEPIITPYSKGCRWNVDVPGIADKAGLTLERSKSAQAGTIFSGVYTK